MSDIIHDIKSEIKKYYKVFAALIIMTVITVAVSGLQVGIALAITVALVIATFKASLVASFFMHLASEKRVIYMVLIMTVIFFAGMMFLTVAGKYSVPQGTKYLQYQEQKDQKEHPDANATGQDASLEAEVNH